MARRSSASALSTPDRQRVDRIIARLHQSTNPAALVQVLPTDLVWLCEQAIATLKRDPILLRLDAPLIVLGDLHGQFSDLCEFVKRGGLPPCTNWLCLGDYVDRGPCSVGTLAYLLALKVKFPKHVWLLRGNHETAEISKVYGFFDECARYEGVPLWLRFVEVFQWLPVAAIVSHRIFCVHGGLSPDMQEIAQIESLRRPLEIPEDGPVSDLLWADPHPGHLGYEPSDRGVAYTFGLDVTEEFLNRHDLDVLCRAHQVVPNGYEFPFEPNRRTVTVFSATNYCGEMGNKGAMMKVDGSLRCTFECLDAAVVAVPPVRPLSGRLLPRPPSMKERQNNC